MSLASPPAVPQRKYRHIFVSPAAMQEHNSKIERNFREGLAKVASPSPTGDSGIGGSSPPTRKAGPAVTSSQTSEDCKGDEDTVSISSSALSDESETTTTTGSKYDRVRKFPVNGESGDKDGDDADDEADETINAAHMNDGDNGGEDDESASGSPSDDLTDSSCDESSRYRSQHTPDLVASVNGSGGVVQRKRSLKQRRNLTAAHHRDSGPYENVFDHRRVRARDLESESDLEGLTSATGKDSRTLQEMLSSGQTSTV